MARTSKPQPHRSAHDQALYDLRRRWYRLSLIPLALILAFAGYVGYATLWTAHGVNSFKSTDLESANTTFKRAGISLPLQKWISPYNLGTTQVAQGAFVEGVKNLKTAEGYAPTIDSSADYSSLDPVDLPPVCKIRINRAEAHARIATDAGAQGDLDWEETQSAAKQAEKESDKQAFDDMVTKAQESKSAAIDAFSDETENFAEAATLLNEFKCTDPEIAKQLEEAAAQAREKQEAAENFQLPEWKEPEDPDSEANSDENSDNESDETDSSENQGQDSDEDPGKDDPENSDSEQEQQDPGTGTPEYSDSEKARQDELDERNKAGKIDREEADAFERSGTPSTKQW